MNDNQILSTYVTYKQLYKNKETDVYDIISEFARHVIIEEQQTSYSQLVFPSLLKKYFDFDIPTLVLKPAIKRIKGVSLENKEYKIDYSVIESNPEFKLMQNEAMQNTNIILDDLVTYIFKKTDDIAQTDETIEEIKIAFRKYILDESSSGPYDAYISAFIVDMSTDRDYTEKINQIREGHILYDGLCQNEAIAAQSWKDQLTIYLDTEIIFHIAGYNGITFQKLTEEFLTLIASANKEKTIIRLRYFSETKEEIDKFFMTAESLFENKSVIRPGETAMISILENCKSSIEITNKKNSLYFRLNKLQIHLEKKSDFYIDKYKQYNLESSEYINTPNEKNVKQLSNINKLRGNNFTPDYSKCIAVLISENGSVLELSRDFTKENERKYTKDSGHYTEIAQLAVNLYTATNIFWYKLNRSLAKSYIPSTIDSVIRARIVLSKFINDSITTEYDSIMKQFQNGELEQDELTALILGMRQRSSKPETILKEGVDDALNLICEKDINKYKENFELERQAHKELEDEYNHTLEELAVTQEDVKFLKEELLIQQHQNNMQREKEKLENIQEWRQMYEKKFDTEKDKAKKSAKLKTLIAIIGYFIYYAVIAFLICKLGWDIMEPITYILGIPPLLYLFTLKTLNIKISLKYWLTSYKRKNTYIDAKDKYEEYLEKENNQKSVIDSFNIN